MSIWDSFSGRKQPKGPEFDSSSAPDASSFFSDVAIPDPTQLHPLSGLNQDTLDYITLEDSALDEALRRWHHRAVTASTGRRDAEARWLGISVGNPQLR